ncbi:hypothetical protein VTI74DRAFT_11481 [Chaetomium olivicolor]
MGPNGEPPRKPQRFPPQFTSSCNNKKSAGELVTCTPAQCSIFDPYNPTVDASFIGTVLDIRGFVRVDPVDKQIVMSFWGTTFVCNWIADALRPHLRLPPILVNYRHTSPEYWIDVGSDGVVRLDEVDYCRVYSNIQCNGGTKSLDTYAHGWYFQTLNGCSTGSTPFRTADGNISDAELEAKLNMCGLQHWAELVTSVAMEE